MIEVVFFFALLIIGSAVIVIALNMSYWAGQSHEEKQGRKYLDSLSHLQRSKSPRDGDRP